MITQAKTDSKMTKRTHCAAVLLAAIFLLANLCSAGILWQNSIDPSGNDAAYNAWLGDVEITTEQVEFFVDFETGFSEGDNISGLSGLLPDGLVITDTSGTYGAVIRSSTGYFGGSRPVGRFAVSHNESAYLVLDFSARPVDYISFQDIDHAGTTIYVDFVDGTTSGFSIETTGTGGDSAEFTGIYRNDMPQILRVRLDATGDGRWGIDNIRYGQVKPCRVDMEHFARFSAQWLMEGADLPADLDHTGQVDGSDLEMFVEQWLELCPLYWPLQ